MRQLTLISCSSPTVGLFLIALFIGASASPNYPDSPRQDGFLPYAAKVSTAVSYLLNYLAGVEIAPQDHNHSGLVLANLPPLPKSCSWVAKTLKFTFHVRYAIGSPDGVTTNNILTINDQFPGPTIHAEVGDTLQVDVINEIQDGQNVTMHWHGLHQYYTIFEDGPAMITQCPLRNGYTKTYKFKVSETGTYWYHSHLGSQYPEGLWGALIVHSKREVYPTDKELVITLSDWYHYPGAVMNAWVFTNQSQGRPPFPNSGLMNGVGRYDCRYANLTTPPVPCDPALQFRPVFKLLPNKTYRLRVINTGAHATFNFSIPGVPLSIIEADGRETAAGISAENITIAVAQRYSLIISTHGWAVGDRKLIRGDIWVDQLPTSKNFTNLNPFPGALMPDVTGILEVVEDIRDDGEMGLESHTYLDPVPLVPNPEDKVVLDEMRLTPWGGPAAQAPPCFNKEFHLKIGFVPDANGVSRGSFNGEYFQLPEDKPILWKVLDGDELPPRTNPLYVERNDVVQVVLYNEFAGLHPIHLHGGHFWVLGKGLGVYNQSRDEGTLVFNGVKRDTVITQPRGWVVLRFVADNPGVLTFHCHIDWHLLTGMSATFVVGKDEVRNILRVPESAKEVCDYFNRPVKSVSTMRHHLDTGLNLRNNYLYTKSKKMCKNTDRSSERC